MGKKSRKNRPQQKPPAPRPAERATASAPAPTEATAGPKSRPKRATGAKAPAWYFLSGRHWLVALGFGLLLLFYFQLPVVKRWHEGRLARYYQQMEQQKRYTKVEERLQLRKRFEYIVPTYLEKQLDSTTLLIPPKDYVKKYIPPGSIGRKHAFYYYTDKFHLAKFNDPYYKSATHAYILKKPKNGQLQPQIVRLQNEGDFDRLRKLYYPDNPPKPIDTTRP
jgi:hypothetical protein